MFFDCHFSGVSYICHGAIVGRSIAKVALAAAIFKLGAESMLLVKDVMTRDLLCRKPNRTG